MQRDLGRLSTEPFDLIVVGGGIYGACAAWEASLRGLSVALLEQGDFGHATSANSQKIVHGGLRYLQSLDVRRMRESIRERRTLLRIAPHLVHPLPFVMPTYRHGWRRKPAMAAALFLNDLIAWDRNDGVADSSHHIPRSHILSKTECLRLAPGIPTAGLTGGAVWCDAQMENSERLTLSVVLSAAEAGATVANYVPVTEWLMEGNRVAGVVAEDALTGQRLEIRSRMVLNASGPWVGRVLAGRNGSRNLRQPLRFLKAMTLLTRSITPQGVAVGVPSRHPQSKSLGLLFMTPWRDRTIVGTAYAPYQGEPDQCEATEQEIQGFIEEINVASPAARLRREEISGVCVGLVPAADGTRLALATRYRLFDHTRLQGIDGLISVLGVKYTTARAVAEKSVDLVFAKLGRRPPRSLSSQTPVWGGRIERLDQFLDAAIRERLWGLSARVTRHLVYSYGCAYPAVLRLVRDNLAWGETIAGSAEVLKAEVVQAVREEMAVKLSDVVFRRTDLAAHGDPGESALRECAQLMAEELDWAAARIEREMDETRARLVQHRASLPAPPVDAAQAGRPLIEQAAGIRA